MTSYFVTRHKGAVQWARKKGIEAEHVAHFDAGLVHEGDNVLGTLPVSIVADICARGGRYFHLSLDIPADERGKELTLQDMEKFGAVLEEFDVRRV